MTGEFRSVRVRFRAVVSAVVVYGTRQCGDCLVAKRTLSELGEPFDWIDLDEHPEDVPIVLALNSGLHVVPTIVLPDGTILVEPDAGELGAAIARLRYRRVGG
jgi:mycoredoxin